MASVSLHIWLFASFLYHLPFRRLLSVDASVPVSLFLPLAMVTLAVLATFDFVVRTVGSRRLKLRLPSRTVLAEAAQNAAILSAACCLLFAACEQQGRGGVGGGGGGGAGTGGTATQSLPLALLGHEAVCGFVIHIDGGPESTVSTVVGVTRMCVCVWGGYCAS